jgi:Glycosyltransferase family 87
LFAPFALLSYGWALLLWLLLNTAIYAACCYEVWRVCPNLQHDRWAVLVLAAAFPGFFHLIAWGQTSGLALACFTLAYLALRKQHNFLAGLAIGCLIFKPQLGLAAAAVFVLALEGKVVLGAVISAPAQLGIGWLHYGSAAMRAYFYATWHVRHALALLEPRPYQMHSLRAFWSLLVPWPYVGFALYLVTAVGVLALAFLCWKSELSLELRYSALLLATVLVAPHLTVYDLVILAPAFLLLGDWIVGAPGRRTQIVGVLLYLCYPLFLLGPLTRVTHVQLSVIVLAGLLWIVERTGRRAGPEKLGSAVSA